jgi:hypothetical protein
MEVLEHFFTDRPQAFLKLRSLEHQITSKHPFASPLADTMILSVPHELW